MGWICYSFSVADVGLTLVAISKKYTGTILTYYIECFDLHFVSGFNIF